jgi:hypothetical protein
MVIGIGKKNYVVWFFLAHMVLQHKTILLASVMVFEVQ